MLAMFPKIHLKMLMNKMTNNQTGKKIKLESQRKNIQEKKKSKGRKNLRKLRRQNVDTLVHLQIRPQAPLLNRPQIQTLLIPYLLRTKKTFHTEKRNHQL